MKVISEIRHENLLRLIDQFGSTAALAKRLQKSHAQISQLKNLLPNTNSGKPRGIGDDLAREMEATLGLEIGWMDCNRTELDSPVVRASDVDFSARQALGQNLKSCRTSCVNPETGRGFTGQEVANEVFGEDSPQSRIANYESGLRLPSLAVLEKLAHLYSTPMSEILPEQSDLRESLCQQWGVPHADVLLSHCGPSPAQDFAESQKRSNLAQTFRVGQLFWSADKRLMVCLDVGERCLVAACVQEHIESLAAGIRIPESRLEVVFDIEQCKVFSP